MTATNVCIHIHVYTIYHSVYNKTVVGRPHIGFIYSMTSHVGTQGAILITVLQRFQLHDLFNCNLSVACDDYNVIKRRNQPVWQMDEKKKMVCEGVEQQRRPTCQKIQFKNVPLDFRLTARSILYSISNILFKTRHWSLN